MCVRNSSLLFRWVQIRGCAWKLSYLCLSGIDVCAQILMDGCLEPYVRWIVSSGNIIATSVSRLLSVSLSSAALGLVLVFSLSHADHIQNLFSLTHTQVHSHNTHTHTHTHTHPNTHTNKQTDTHTNIQMETHTSLLPPAAPAVLHTH